MSGTFFLRCCGELGAVPVFGGFARAASLSQSEFQAQPGGDPFLPGCVAQRPAAGHADADGFRQGCVVCMVLEDSGLPVGAVEYVIDDAPDGIS